MQTVEELIAAANADPQRALVAASEVAERAQENGQHALAAGAWRAAALAAANMAQMQQAVDAAHRAVRSAEMAGNPEVLTGCRTTLAGVLAWSGDNMGAKALLEELLRDGGTKDRARVLAQLGAVLYQTSDFDDAIAVLDLAIPELEESGDRTWLAHGLTNRGIVHGYVGRLDRARADLSRARLLYGELGLQSSVAESTQNLAWLAATEGDIRVSLKLFDEAEDLLSDLGYPLAKVQRDRCDVLLAAHLVDEARAAATHAARELGQYGHAGYAEALIRLARAQILGSDPVAHSTAQEAARIFDSEGRHAWSSYSRLIAAEAVARIERRLVDAGEVLRIRDALVVAGLSGPAASAQLLAAETLLTEGRVAEAGALVEAVTDLSSEVPLDIRARRSLISANLRQAEGDEKGARLALNEGLEVVETAQARVGAMDLQASIAGYGRELAELLVDIAFSSGDPWAILEAAEVSRVRSLHLPLRGPQALTPELAALRAVERRILASELDAAELAELTRRREDLERRIQRASRTTAVPAREVAEAGPVGGLDSVDLLEFVEHDGSLWRLVVSGAEPTLSEVGSVADVRQEFEFLRAGLIRASLNRERAEAAHGLVTATAAILDELLLSNLPTGDRPLLLSPTPSLFSEPWMTLPALAGRATTIIPSLRAWQRVSRRRLDATSPVVAVAGPDLIHAPEEARRVASIHDGTSLLGEEATADNVLRLLDGAPVAHVAAHGIFRADNPLFSALRLADGSLSVYDLERLAQVPATVLLSACDLGQSTASHGLELMSFVTAMLRLGSRTVVASVVPVNDEAVLELMSEVHRPLAAGVQPAEALRSVRESVGSDPLLGLAMGSFAAFGS